MMEYVLLPIAKWLIAKHPIPLSINRISNGIVSEHQVIEIVCIETGCVIGVIAKALTVYLSSISTAILSVTARYLQPGM